MAEVGPRRIDNNRPIVPYKPKLRPRFTPGVRGLGDFGDGLVYPRNRADSGRFLSLTIRRSREERPVPRFARGRVSILLGRVETAIYGAAIGSDYRLTDKSAAIFRKCSPRRMPLEFRSTR